MYLHTRRSLEAQAENSKSAAEALKENFGSGDVTMSDFAADMLYCVEHGIDPDEYLRRSEFSRARIRVAQELQQMAQALERFENWQARKKEEQARSRSRGSRSGAPRRRR